MLVALDPLRSAHGRASWSALGLACNSYSAIYRDVALIKESPPLHCEKNEASQSLSYVFSSLFAGSGDPHRETGPGRSLTYVAA
jgi:hypothetical protein